MHPNPWTDAFLDDLRLVGDPPADAAVASLYETVLTSEEAFARVNRLLNQATFADEIDWKTVPEAVRRFAQETLVLPSWLDPELAEQGRRLFERYGMADTVLLTCAALPECYSLAKGVHVIALTTMLKDRPGLRILETARLVQDVMSKGGLGSGGKGVRAAKKIRLIHAAIRYLVLHGDPNESQDGLGQVLARQRWEPEWGTPICQEDLGFVLQTFAYVTVRGLGDLGVELSERDKEAWIHCWSVIGALLGVDRLLLPEPGDGVPAGSRYELAEAVYARIRSRQLGASEEGRVMTQSLIDFLERTIDARSSQSLALRLLGRRRLLLIPRHLMRYLVGPETADILGIAEPPESWWDRVFLRTALRLAKRLERTYQRHGGRPGLVQHLADGLHALLEERMQRMASGHKQVYLPERLPGGSRPVPAGDAEGEPEERWAGAPPSAEKGCGPRVLRELAEA